MFELFYFSLIMYRVHEKVDNCIQGQFTLLNSNTQQISVYGMRQYIFI